MLDSYWMSLNGFDLSKCRMQKTYNFASSAKAVTFVSDISQ